jgi:uncharacterized protein YndB with AHSA1/START domain
MIDVSRRLAVGPEAVWAALTDLDAWPQWGPSLRRAELDGGGDRIAAGATGRVQTAVGLWAPFEVTAWNEGRSWAWSVAGVPATAHAVAPVTGVPGASLATIAVPTWALPYSALCWVAIGRLGRVAAARDRAG